MTLPVTPRHTITYLGPSWKKKYHHLRKVSESITETTVRLKAIKNQQYVSGSGQTPKQNRTWKRHSCWEGGEKKEEKNPPKTGKSVDASQMKKRWQCSSKHTDTGKQ